VLKRLDAAVLFRVEEWCHRFQRVTGRTNFTLARVAHIGAVLGLALAGVTGPRNQDAWLVSGAIGSFAWMYCTIIWGVYQRVEEHYREAPHVAHPFTLLWRSMMGQRMFSGVIVLSVLAAGLFRFAGPVIGVLWYAMAGLCWLAALYLQCVTPLPPCGSRLRQWLASWLGKPHLSPAPSAA
jgi:hypothetical protein